MDEPAEGKENEKHGCVGRLTSDLLERARWRKLRYGVWLTIVMSCDIAVSLMPRP